MLAEGTQGYLTGAAIDRFGLHGRNPQVWALGVKEVWRVPRAAPQGDHTMGWPLRSRKRYREFGGSFIYPMGDDLVSLGMVVGLDYRDVSVSIHDLLQELKTHKLVRGILDGGERIAWGAKTIPEGGFYSLPSQLHAPGVVFCGDGAGFVNVPALKGIHYAIESGVLAAEAISGALRPGEAVGRSGALSGYDDAIRQSFVWKDLKQVRNMRQAFAKGFWRGSMRAGAMTMSRGHTPAKGAPHRARRGAGAHPHRSRRQLSGAGRQADIRQALVRLPQRQPDPRRCAEPHSRRPASAARGRRALGEHVPRARIRARARGRGQGRGRRHSLQLCSVRRDHRQGRPPAPGRGRRRPGVHTDVSAETEDIKVGFPLWGIGAAVALWGLLRGRPLLFLAGAGAFLADHDAGPVRRVRELVGLERGLVDRPQGIER